MANKNVNRMKNIKWIFPVVLFVFLAGCSSSRLVYSWRSPDLQPRTFSKIMVVALIRDADRQLQTQMEDHLVGDLRERGYQAISSIQEFGPRAFDKMDENAVLDRLKNSGVDAVMTIVMLDKSREKYYVPGRVIYSPYGLYHNRFYGYYITMYDRIYTPGYYEVSTRYFWESNLYDLSGKKLLYTVQSESFDPANASTQGHEYGKLIVSDMVGKGVLPLMVPGRN
jgi:hypothetical protein